MPTKNDSRLAHALRVICIAWGIAGTTTTAEDWPHWRGMHRDDTVNEASGWNGTGWLQSLPVWSVDVGDGSTSPIVADGRLYAMGWRGGRDTVVAMDAATGKQIWSADYPCPRYGRHALGDQGLYSGPTSTPEFDAASRLLFTLSCDGDLNAWSAKDGNRVWSLNLYERYGMQQRPKVGRSGRRDYGYTTSPLVHGDWLIVEVGSTKGTLVAFDKRTGKHAWASEDADYAGHTGGLVPLTVGDVPCLAAMTFKGLLVVRLDQGHAGKTIGRIPWNTGFANNIAAPGVFKQSLIITSGYTENATSRVDVALDGLKPVWKTEGVVSKTCSPVVRNRRIYWAWNQLQCLDFETGRTLWTGPRVGDAGSCIATRDDKLIVWSGRGDLFLADISNADSEYRELARAGRLDNADVWPHVTLADGFLYCKGRKGTLRCLKLGGPSKSVVLNSTPVVTSPQPRSNPSIKLPTERTIDLTKWPGKEGVVVAWAGSEIVSKDAATPFEPRGNARQADGRLVLSRGAFLAPTVNSLLLNACKKSNQFALEVVLSTDDLLQTGPARIVSFSLDPYHRNFTLTQEKSQVGLRLRTTRTGENGMLPETKLFQIVPQRDYHIIVSYQDSLLACFVNGELVLTSNQVRGDFSNWTPQHFVIGDEWKDSRFWSGTIARIAVLNRFIGKKEAQARYRLWRPTGD